MEGRLARLREARPAEGTRMTAPGSSMPSDTEPRECLAVQRLGFGAESPRVGQLDCSQLGHFGMLLVPAFAGCHFCFSESFPFGSPYLSFCFHPHLTERMRLNIQGSSILISSRLTDSFLLIQPLIRHHLLAPNCMSGPVPGTIYAAQI